MEFADFINDKNAIRNVLENAEIEKNLSRKLWDSKKKSILDLRSDRISWFVVLNCNSPQSDYIVVFGPVPTPPTSAIWNYNMRDGDIVICCKRGTDSITAIGHRLFDQEFDSLLGHYRMLTSSGNNFSNVTIIGFDKQKHSPTCDCGGKIANTTCSDWCQTYKPFK